MTGELSNGGSAMSSNASLVNVFISNIGVEVGTGSLFLSAEYSQYVQISSLQNTNAGLSFSLWFMNRNSSSRARLFDFGNGVNSDNILITIHHDNLAFIVFKGGVVSRQLLNVVVNINDGVWRHVVWTLDPVGGVWKVYINGNLIWQGTDNDYPNILSRTSNFLGKSNWANDPYFNGGIDEFRMYNRVLTASEVKLLYSGNSNELTFGADSCSGCPAGTI